MSKDVSKQSIVLGLMAMLAAGSAALAGPEVRAVSINTTINIDDDETLERCDQIKVKYSDDDGPLPTARDEAVFDLPRAKAEPLVLHVPEGGIRVQSWDKDDYSIRVCKSAAGRTEEKARKTLESIGLSLSGGRLDIDAPSNRAWNVHLIVKVPKNAQLELQTENGEINLKNVSGSIHAKSENGPIDLTKCSQKVDATTENGPISIRGGRGDFRVRAQNGPISVDLLGTSWDGTGLEARTENGPLSLNLPGNYKSGIRVQAKGYSPMSCKAPECKAAHKSWDDNQRWIEFNGDPQLVKLYTVNGPISVGSKAEEF